MGSRALWGPGWKEEMVNFPWFKFKESEKHHSRGGTAAELLEMKVIFHVEVRQVTGIQIENEPCDLRGNRRFWLA